MTEGRSEIKPDWKEAEARMRDWWAGKRTDRVVASVYAPKTGVSRKPAREGLPNKYTDFETTVYNFESELESTFYGGEAFPCYWIYHGPVPMSAYFGGEPNFRNDTVWYKPLYDSWDSAKTWTFDPGNKWWQMVLRLTRLSLERAGGRYLVSGSGLCGIADVIANLWGVESMLMQITSDPGLISDLLGRMIVSFKKMYDELYEITRRHQDGYFDWPLLWAPGRLCTLQNDISCMVSPRTFREIFLEEIRQEARHVEYALYHLDGPDAIKHLDALLDIEELRLVQWSPGAGASADPMDWLDLFRRIQSKGRKVWTYCTPERVRDLLSRIDRQSVYLNISCPDEKAAHACLSELDRIGG